MRYGSPAALRMALGQRLRNKSQESGTSVDRLRRRVMYERIVVRLDLAAPVEADSASDAFKLVRSWWAGLDLRGN